MKYRKIFNTRFMEKNIYTTAEYKLLCKLLKNDTDESRIKYENKKYYSKICNLKI